MKEKFNYRLMLLSNSIACLAFNLIGPFFVLFINKLGGSLENLGLLFGMSILANSIASYFIGKYSDRFGRKPFLLLSSFLSSVIIVLYIYITNLPQLYALQIANGINTAMWMTSERIFMADITKKETRGKSIGFYDMILGILAAIGVMSGGFVIGKFGFEIIFWFVGIISFISSIILIFIKEKKLNKT